MGWRESAGPIGFGGIYDLSWGNGGIINYTKASSTPSAGARKEGEHTYVSIATIKISCGLLRGVPGPHLHRGLLVSLLLGFRQLLVGGSSGHGLRRVANTSAGTPTSLW